MGNSPPRRASAARELERFTNPTGLYPSCPWDTRIVRRLILEKRLAPRFPGRDGCESCFTQECPICFMFYPGTLNLSTCCKKPICSECYLQLKPPKKVVSCPYCNNEAFGIKYAAPAVISLSSIYSSDKDKATTDSRRSTPDTSELSPPASASTGAAGAAGASAAHGMAQYFASAEDRARIRDDLRSQLQLTAQPITSPPPPPPASSAQQQQPRLLRTTSNGANFIITSAEDAALLAEPRYIIASAADARRLEEMMMVEAIRRSMRDLHAGKADEVEGEEEGEEGQDEEDSEELEYRYSNENSGDHNRRSSSGYESSGHSSSSSNSSGDTLRPPQSSSSLSHHAPPPAPVTRRPSTNPFDDVVAHGESTSAHAEPPQRRESASWNPYDE